MASASSSSETELPPPTPGRERVPTSPVVSEADPKDEAGYGSAAASGSGDASQPAGRSYGTVYTAGVDQEMLTSSRNVRKHMHNVEKVIKTCVQDEGLHIMNLCELGGHRQGLSAAGIYIFEGPTPAAVSVNKNYLTA